MISIKCRVLIKTVQHYSISNMTIKITRGPKWIAHCANSSKENIVSDIQRALMEIQLGKKKKNVIIEIYVY